MSEIPQMRHNEAASRYEAEIEGQSVVLGYRLRGNQLTLVHTDVPKSLEGRGIGSALAKATLEDARVRGLEVVPECPFVAWYIRRHPEYLPLVEAGSRRQVEGTN